MARTPWARGSNQYVKKLRTDEHGPSSTDDEITLSTPQPELREAQMALVGCWWDSSTLGFDLIESTSTERARARFRAMLPEYIWDAASLEGNPYTLPEVRTLLEGTTVAGHRLADEQQILALNEAYNELDLIVGSGQFALTKAVSDRLHGLVAIHEAIESGHFRGEGGVGGGGLVGLGERGFHQASDGGPGGEALLAEHAALLRYISALSDPREQALASFCGAALRQFYFDGNKRTARLMMGGHLMAHGFDNISVSANRRLEFNEHLTTLYADRDATPLMAFIIDSRPR